MADRPTFAVRITAGSWAVDANMGFRLFNSDREEIAALNGNAAEFRRIGETFLKVAREKEAIEIFE